MAYAVPSFGGFLGIGDDYCPLPWESAPMMSRLTATVSTSLRIRRAPRLKDDDRDCYRDNGRNVYDFYGVPPYWI